MRREPILAASRNPWILKHDALGTRMKVLIILMTLISGGMAAGSRPHKEEKFSDVIKFPLFGSEDLSLKGLFFTKIRLGSPPQELNVLVDTGSDLFWVNCPSYEEKNLSKLYKWEESVTSSPVNCSKEPCSFDMNYNDRGSISGFYVRDVLHYDTFLRNSFSNMSTSVKFGCSTRRNAVLNDHPEVEGIMGLGPRKMSLISQLSSLTVAPPVFTHCLASRGDGFLLLGQVLDADFTYTPIISKYRYEVALESITINGDQLPVDPRVFSVTRLDSAAKRSLLEAETYDLLLKAVSVSVNQSWYLGPRGLPCYQVSASETFPDVHFDFHGGASLTLKPANYLIQVDRLL
uniref:Peptidase A1 domain-containing protein n=1 Tax=Kalanchoe fedtschenkoi TaxID=63787 RepID=A0A7N0URR1_KALFE